MPDMNIIGSSNEHRSPQVSAALSLNLYPEITDGSDNKAPVVLIGTPGTKIWADFSSTLSGKCRGTAWAGNKLYLAFGAGVYRVDVDPLTNAKTAVLIQALSPGPTRVKFADDGFHLMFCDGRNMWATDLGTNVTSVVTTDAFSFPIDIKYLYSRFFCINADPSNGTTKTGAPITRNSNKVFWSGVGLNGFSSWEGANYEAASLNSDSITGIDLRQGEVYLLGNGSYEVFAYTGDFETPLKRVGGSAANVGLLAPESLASIADQLYWIGSSAAGKNQVFATSNGYDVKRISTHAIEAQFNLANSQGKSTNDFVGFTYQMEGHTFYVITSRNVNKTFAYDVTTGTWHNRSTRDPLHNSDGYWLPMFAVYAYDTVLVANDYDPMVLELDLNTYADYVDPATGLGRAPIIRQRRTGPVFKELRNLLVRELIVDMQAGVGISNGQGSDPQMMLRVSYDGGRTWSNTRTESIGRIGDFSRRVRFRGLGMGNNVVFEMTISDPVKVVLVGAQLYYELSKNR